jgi:hypothetical protein
MASLTIHFAAVRASAKRPARCDETGRASRVADAGAALDDPEEDVIGLHGLKRDVEPETVAIKRQGGGSVSDDEARGNAGDLWFRHVRLYMYANVAIIETGTALNVTTWMNEIYSWAVANNMFAVQTFWGGSGGGSQPWSSSFAPEMQRISNELACH